MPRKYILKEADGPKKSKSIDNASKIYEKYVDFSSFQNVDLSELKDHGNIEILQKNLDNLIFREIDIRTLPSPNIRYEAIKLFQLSQEGLKERLRQQEILLETLDHYMLLFEKKKK